MMAIGVGVDGWEEEVEGEEEGGKKEEVEEEGRFANMLGWSAEVLDWLVNADLFVRFFDVEVCFDRRFLLKEEEFWTISSLHYYLFIIKLFIHSQSLVRLD